MKAIAFLALLVGYASAKGNYSWNEPGARVPPTPPRSVCQSDTSACGCCLMQQTMHRMEQFFNMGLSKLEHSLQETRGALNNIRASRSAFSVALTDHPWCLGPLDSDKTIVYKQIFLNLGSNYNQDNGIYIVPRSGVYSLSLTVYSDSGSSGKSLVACAMMKVNDLVVAALKDTHDQEDSSTSVLALMLSAGDKVHVVLPKGCYLCDNVNHYNTFSGILLYATD